MINSDQLNFLALSASEHQLIVNGTIAHPCELPHLVYVVIYREIGKMMCSGSLIDSTHVASAGHCVLVPNIHQITI